MTRVGLIKSMSLALMLTSDRAQKSNTAYHHVYMAHVQMIHTSVNVLMPIPAENVIGFNVQCAVLLRHVTAPSQKIQGVFLTGTMTVAW